VRVTLISINGPFFTERGINLFSILDFRFAIAFDS
jgi:hypothetical protein